MRIDERRKIREVRTQLTALNIQELEAAIRFARSEIPESLQGDFYEERARLTELWEAFETQRLIRIAESWGIEVPYKREWYTETTPDPRDPDTKDELWLDRLNSLGRAVVTKQIRDARFEYWRGWAQILIPILSLIVAILALLKK